MLSVATFSAEDLKQYVRLSRRAREVSANGPAGWSPANTDPAALLRAFPALALDPRWELRAYQFRKERHGNGVVWAVPSGSPVLTAEACPTIEGSRMGTPRPPGALDSPMLAIRGDGSPESYLQASLLFRELAEFGSLGQGVNWGYHAVVDALPPARAGAWRWIKARPADWRPTVEVLESGAAVVFYTTAARGQEAIFMHSDWFAPETYLPDARQTIIAAGGAGYLP